MADENSVAIMSQSLTTINSIVEPLQQSLNDRDFFQLPRNELIFVLGEIKKVLSTIESKFAEKNKLEKDLKALVAKQKQNSGIGANIGALIVIGFVSFFSLCNRWRFSS